MHLFRPGQNDIEDAVQNCEPEQYDWASAIQFHLSMQYNVISAVQACEPYSTMWAKAVRCSPGKVPAG
jgi:hypothetical protein